MCALRTLRYASIHAPVYILVILAFRSDRASEHCVKSTEKN